MSGDIKAIFDSNLIATQAGTVQVFHFDMASREFIGAEETYIHIGVGLPAFSCLEEPPVQSEYQVAVRSEDNSSRLLPMIFAVSLSMTFRRWPATLLPSPAPYLTL